MLKSGLKPLAYDRRDYDLHKTFGAAVPPKFPDAYSVENGLWTPDQNRGGELFNLDPQPFGCTNFTQCDVAADDDGVLYNPAVLENYTHANAKGGLDIRVSLKATTLKDMLKDALNNSGPQRTAYFAIKPTYPLDMFDAIRLAMLSTADEGRSVSAGTPWFSDWWVPKDGILPTPISFSLQNVPWHNFKVPGWKTIDGKPYLICKPWCGKDYGDKGFVYMSRELCNAVFGIYGTCAFTLTKLKGLEPQRIDFEFIAWVVSFIRSIFGLDAPTPPVVPVVEPAPPAPTPTPESPAERLAEAARAALGTDVTPDDKVPDEVACVASLVAIMPPEFGLDRKLIYTPALLSALKKNPRFKAVLDPSVGTIVVSPTVGTQVGHCGIYVEPDGIASNNSFGLLKGKWTVNYTRQQWRSYFGTQKGLKGYLFDAI